MKTLTIANSNTTPHYILYVDYFANSEYDIKYVDLEATTIAEAMKEADKRFNQYGRYSKRDDMTDEIYLTRIFKAVGKNERVMTGVYEKRYTPVETNRGYGWHGMEDEFSWDLYRVTYKKRDTWFQYGTSKE